jgi:hypothetical protein
VTVVVFFLLATFFEVVFFALVATFVTPNIKSLLLQTVK